VPIALAMVTSYMKVSIVLGMLRNGLGTPQVPSGTVIMALSVALTDVHNVSCYSGEL